VVDGARESLVINRSIPRSHWLHFSFVVTLAAFLFLSSPASANDNWLYPVKEIAKARAKEVIIRDKRERIIARVDGGQMLHLYAVMTALREVAEVQTEFYITGGKQPNAWACPECPIGEKPEDRMSSGNRWNKKEDEQQEPTDVKPNVVAINMGMLELFESDMHEAAAIIGHELAHLKLKHGEKSQEQHEKQQRSGGNVFSAAGTRFSRDHEREADYLGVIWSIEAGYDPAAAARVHEKLYKLPKGGFGGSHPSSIERITVLKSLARRLAR